MKLYIAGPWKYRDEVRAAATLFKAASHTITEEWWDHLDITHNSSILPIDREEMARQARADWAGVWGADQLIFLNLAYSEGKCVELGMALADKIPICAVGEPGMNAFHYLPEVVWVHTVEEAIERLRR